MRRVLIATLIACLAILSCSKAPTEPQRVLMVGNSLTYYNDLPRLIEVISASQNPAQPLLVDMLAADGVSLQDHIDHGRLYKFLQQGNYDFVVLQDVGGWPLCSSNDTPCKNLPESLRAISSVADLYATQTIWFSTWTSRAQAQPVLSTKATEFGRVLGIRVADTGAALDAIRKNKRSFKMLDDGNHPTTIGSVAIALVAYQTVTGRALKPNDKDLNYCARRWREIGLLPGFLTTTSDRQACVATRISGDLIMQVIIGINAA